MVGQDVTKNVPAAVLAAAKREFNPDRRVDPPVPAVSAGGTGRVVVTPEVSRPTIYVVGRYNTVRYGELDDFIIALPPDVIEVPAGGDEVVYYHPASGTKVVWYHGDAYEPGYAELSELGDIDVRALELIQRPEEVLRYAASTIPSQGVVHVVAYHHEHTACRLMCFTGHAGRISAFWAEMIQRAQGLPWARAFERIVVRNNADIAPAIYRHDLLAADDGITYMYADITVYTVDLSGGAVPALLGGRLLTAEEVWVGASDAEMRAVVRALAIACGARGEDRCLGVIGPARAYEILKNPPKGFITVARP